MKLKSTLFTLSLLAAMVLFIQAKRPAESQNTTFMADTVVEFSAEVKAVIDQKCFGCHNTNSKNEKGKGKLQWDTMTTLSKAKQIALMDEVIEVLEEGKMPPEKFLAYKPEGKLSEEEVKMLKDWANANAERLLK
jgi:uncharacterized membrane protein